MTEFAVIDVGSNSIRYSEEEHGALPHKEVYTTRLGKGLFAAGALSEESMAKSYEVLSALCSRARSGGFIPMAYATSAVRDASNGRDFARRVTEGLGLPVRILSGREEARFAFAAAGAGFDAMLDIGGASMQVVTKDIAVSFPAGCVRMGEIAREAVGAQTPDSVRPLQRAAVTGYVFALMRELSVPPVGRLVGVGGTITTLAALQAGLTSFDPDTVDRTVLTYSGVGSLVQSLEAMGPEGRRSHPLLSARHDVILYGADLLSAAMRRLGVHELSVSCADGMEGYLYELRRQYGT